MPAIITRRAKHDDESFIKSYDTKKKRPPWSVTTGKTVKHNGAPKVTPKAVHGGTPKAAPKVKKKPWSV